MTNGNNAVWATLTLKGKTDKTGIQKYTLSTTENTVVGRSPDCEIPLDPHEFITVSRRHAEIKLVDAAWRVKDLGTPNGTLVNDQLIDRSHQLESGDLITLGKKGPEFAFECLILNATVMVQPTEMNVVSEPNKAKVSSPKAEDRPRETPKAEAKATISAAKEVEEVKAKVKTKQTIPAAPEVKPEAATSIAEAKPLAEATESSKSPNEPVAKKDAILEPQAEPKQSANEPTPKATLKSKESVGATPKSNTPISAKPDRILWNLISSTEICQIDGNSQPVLALAFSPDKQTLASATKDKVIKLWNLTERAEIATLTGHKLAPNALSFSPDGKTLASGGADKTIKLWNLDSKEEVASFSGHKLAINALCFSPDGKILASGSADKTVKLWNLDDRAEISAIVGHKLAIESIAFSPDGKTIASGSKDKTFKLWNLDSKEEIAVMAGHKQAVIAIAFSPDGNTIASAGADQTIKLWNLDRLEIATIATPSWQSGAIAISADGQIAGSDEQGAIRIWQV